MFSPGVMLSRGIDRDAIKNFPGTGPRVVAIQHCKQLTIFHSSEERLSRACVDYNRVHGVRLGDLFLERTANKD